LHGLDGIDIDITSPAGPIAVRGLALPGLHNAYNATAAAAAALALGVPVSRIGYALQSSQAAFGRSERLTVDGRELVMLHQKSSRRQRGRPNAGPRSRAARPRSVPQRPDR
jgi:UDP-N-acetylmuramyl tripeptide synthase